MSENAKRDGGVTLLQEDHFEMKNPWGPVVGWLPTSQGIGGLFNPRGWSFLRVVLWKLANGARQYLYDQPMIVENAGAIVIAQLGDRVALAQNFRMVGERLLPNAGANYVKQLDGEKRWEELLETIGDWRWEAPRGLIPSGPCEGEELNKFIVRTAKLEALQEAGLKITNTRLVGRVNWNSTFCPHPQYVVYGEIVSIGNSSPEDLEIIGDKRLFTMAELRQLNKEGKFDDGLALAALALCGLTL